MKYLFFFLFIFSIESYSNIDSSLVLNYSFDNEDAFDESGNNLHGTIYNSFQFVDFAGGKALKLNGQPGNSDKGGYVRLPDLDYSLLGDFTINMWVNLQDLSDQGSHFFFAGDIHSGYIGLGYFVDWPDYDRKLYLQGTSGGMLGRDNNWIEPPIIKEYDSSIENTWINLTLIQDEQRLQLRVNGEIVGNRFQEITSGFLKTAINATFWDDNMESRFTAIYDDIRIYDRVLSDDEIFQLNDKLEKIQACENEKSFAERLESNQFNLVGDAYNFRGIVNLTNSDFFQAGAIWSNDIVNVNKDFEFNFKVDLTSPNGALDDGSNPGGSGFAFVIQNHGFNALGGHAHGLGFSGIPNSFAVEFDLEEDSFRTGDPNGNHLAIFCNGSEENTSDHNQFGPMLEFEELPFDFATDGSKYLITFQYISQEKRLKIFMSPAEQYNILVFDFDGINFSELLDIENNNYAIMGVTASTGSSYMRHGVSEINICSDDIISHVSLSSTSQDLLFNENSISFKPDLVKINSIVDINGINQNIDILPNSSNLNISSLENGLYLILYEYNGLQKVEKILKVD